MKNTEFKKIIKIIMLVGAVLLVAQFAVYIALSTRIQEGEGRIYTNLHEMRVDVMKMQNNAQQ